MPTYIQLAEDLFQRPDENPLNPAVWTASAGGGNAVVSHLFVNDPLNPGNDGDSIYTGVVFPDDQYAEMVVGPGLDGANVIGIGVQADATERSTATFQCLGDGSSAFVIDQNGTIIFTVTLTPLVIGDTLRIEIVGLVVTVKQNGVIVGTGSPAAKWATRVGPQMIAEGTNSISAFRAGEIITASSVDTSYSGDLDVALSGTVLEITQDVNTIVGGESDILLK